MTPRAVTSDPSGFVYLIVHPHFAGWVKVGSTTNPRRRLGSYNTGDPERRYRMLMAVQTADRRLAEWLAHERLRALGFDKQGEWFLVAPAFAGRVVRRAVAQADEDVA